MSPEKLRALVAEATPEVMSEIADSTGASGEAWHQLTRLAPDLALLCAEMGDVLEAATDPAESSQSYEHTIRRYAKDALAKLEALEAR